MKAFSTKPVTVILLLLGMCLMGYKAGIADETIKLGFVGPLSGELSSYGIPALRGVEMAIEVINRQGGIKGRWIDLYVEDDQCLPKDASIKASKLVVRGVHAVVGHICSGATRSALNIYLEAGVLVISPSATHPSLTQSGDHPNFFRTIASDDIQAKVQVEFVLGILKLKRIAVLHDMTVYGKGLAEMTKAIVRKDKRSELVFYDGIPPGTIEYSSIIHKLKRTRAEVVMFGGYHPQASKIVSQLRVRKMKTIFISSDGIKDKAFVVSAGKFAEGVYATAPKDISGLAGAIDANRAYEKAYGTAPGALFLNSYAAAEAVLNAIHVSGSMEYTSVLNVLKTTRIETPIGHIRFDEHGDARGPNLGFSVYRVEKGAFVKVQ